ncbi:WXG100 family type VII secretion target [Herbiconiux sp. P18]|uniref:WXG100 family type VII secretion target n=1 Tax=Herbiconiux liangxiaofengii TaxID=3342795 RepID=UPI0035B830D9
MTGGFWGADADQLRALAKDFDQKATQLSGMASTLTASINGASAWSGPDAALFKQDWNSTYRASLTSANQSLLAAASALVKNADEQEQASSDDGGAGPGGSGPGGSGPGGSPFPGTDGSGTGDAGDDGSMLDDILNSPVVGSINDYLNAAGIVGGVDALLQLRLGGAFSSLDAALDFRAFAGGFNTASDFFNGNNWGSLTQGLSNVLGDGALASRVGSAAEFLGTAGKVLGPAGVVLGYAGAYNSYQKGDYVRAGYDTVATTIGAVALFTPPPANLVLGAVSGGMALGGLLYDNVPVFHDAVDNTAEAIGDAGEAIAEGAQDFAEGVADVAEDLWPW